ncbi:MAG: NAD-dependent epimerase/dehydratase family protein [Ruminococcus sp.]|nr:NAD-dependent epimerase/dehydratase family protein [Ruminococcus sp.]
MILVTGATGFLGKRVCKKLDELQLDYKKTSLSLGTDLRDEQQTLKLFEETRPDYVLHCASYVGGIQFGMKHTAEMYRNGLLMQVNMFEACRKYNVKRLVNPISNCAYPGEATLFKEDEFWNGPLHDSVLIYGMVRKMSYVGAVAYQRQYNTDTVNLILSNMYGPEDHFEAERSHALGALIMKFVDAKENGKPNVCVWGTGTPVREWLHVDDGAYAMIRAMDIEPYADPINIGIAKGISIKDMALLIKKIVGYEGELVFDTSKLDGAPYKTVDGSLGERLLQWKPSIDFETGVRETVEWYINYRKAAEK